MYGDAPWIGESGVTRMSVCWGGGNGQFGRMRMRMRMSQEAVDQEWDAVVRRMGGHAGGI